LLPFPLLRGYREILPRSFSIPETFYHQPTNISQEYRIPHRIRWILGVLGPSSIFLTRGIAPLTKISGSSYLSRSPRELDNISVDTIHSLDIDIITAIVISMSVSSTSSATLSSSSLPGALVWTDFPLEQERSRQEFSWLYSYSADLLVASAGCETLYVGWDVEEEIPVSVSLWSHVSYHITAQSVVGTCACAQEASLPSTHPAGSR